VPIASKKSLVRQSLQLCLSQASTGYAKCKASAHSQKNQSVCYAYQAIDLGQESRQNTNVSICDIDWPYIFFTTQSRPWKYFVADTGATSIHTGIPSLLGT
jgi:hypothetical protein